MSIDRTSFFRVVMMLMIISINTSFFFVKATDDFEANVLVYTGAGAWLDGVLAFEQFLEFKGLTWLECDGSYLNGNELVGKFDIIHFPGGDSSYYISNINYNGLQHIRDFIASGGGYIGICAGGYFACDRIMWEDSTYDNPLDLFLGVGYGAIDEIAPWPNYAMTTITINSQNPINQYEPSSEVILYYGGAAYYPDQGQEINIIGTYDLLNNHPAMINFEYGDGRVILLGPHPEIEEDSTRDGVLFGDDLLDIGTDWNLIWTCLDWLRGVPISEPPTSLPPNTPSITGPQRGKTGWRYSYTLNTKDPEEEELYYLVDWGDNTTSEWVGPYPSGEISIEHIWMEENTYIIRCKAKDMSGGISDWANLIVTMPYSFNLISHFFEWLLVRFSSILRSYNNA